MKKNWTLKAAGILLALTLITSCFVGGTFAKYVTAAGSTNTARVAKFGVEVSADSSSMFKTKYTTDDTSATSITNSVSVTSGDSSKLVAPGTKEDNTLIFSITGTPEVAVKVEIKLDVVSDVFLKAGTYQDRTKAPYNDTFDVAEGGYYPVVFTLKKGDTQIAQGNLDTIETEIEKLSNNYEAGSDSTKSLAAIAGEYTLSWEWAFETGSTDEEKAKFNAADTLLGDLAAKDTAAAGQEWKWSDTDNGFVEITADNFSTNIEFTLSITITQID